MKKVIDLTVQQKPVYISLFTKITGLYPSDLEIGVVYWLFALLFLDFFFTSFVGLTHTISPLFLLVVDDSKKFNKRLLFLWFDYHRKIFYW